MAQIDLKNVTMEIKDGGTKKLGAVSSAAVAITDGITAGALAAKTATVVALAAAKYKGQTFTNDGDTTVYTLTADAAQGATAIVFEPGLAVAVTGATDITFTAGCAAGESRIRVGTFQSGDVLVGQTINFVGSDITYMVQAIDTAVTTLITISPVLDVDIANAAVATTYKTPNSITVKIGEGNFTYSEKRNMEYVLDRGKLDTVREGDEVPMEISFDFTWEFISAASGDSAPTVEEALKRSGKASQWTSTSEDACEPYAVDISLKNVPGCGFTGQNEVLLFPDFRWESLEHDASNGAVAVQGKCNAKNAVTLRDVAGL